MNAYLHRLQRAATITLLLGALTPALRAQEVYQPTWESLDRHQMPAWYDDAKIGLSMHWGVYAVPASAPRDVEEPQQLSTIV